MERGNVEAVDPHSVPTLQYMVTCLIWQHATIVYIRH